MATMEKRRGRPATGECAALVAPRVALDISQEQAGQCCGVAQPTVSRWERGEDQPDKAALEHLARLYGIDYAKLARAVADYFFALEYS